MKPFIDYLITACKKEWEIKKSIEDKASKLILASSIIISIIVAVVIDGYYISRDNLDIIQIILLLSAIIFGMMSIRHAIDSSKPTLFPNLIDIYKLFDLTTGRINSAEITKFRNNEYTEFEDKVVEDYIKILDFNKKYNKKSASSLEKSFGAFKFLLLFIFLFVLAVLFF